jgi:hypothetical protein
MRREGSLEILSMRWVLEIVHRLSQLTTQGFGIPSSFPRGTSIRMLRIVAVISAATH